MGTDSKYFSCAAAAELLDEAEFEAPGRADSGPLLELCRVSKVFANGDEAIFALDEIDLQIQVGEFVAVMGASRSGKSTCLNILGCLDTPSLGSYRFCGVPLESLPGDQLAQLRRRYVGFLFSRPGLIANATVLENVEQPLFNRGLSFAERTQSAMAALVRVGLEDSEELLPDELTSSQQQRLAVARAIAGNPALLLVDDPTSHLETPARVELLQLLSRLNTELKLTTVMITHRIDSAAFADRVVRLHEGRIVAEGRRIVALS